MCGIAGLLVSGARTADGLHDAVVRMTNAIAHRGPDGSGAWVDAAQGVALGHRRLSIIDLSEAGAQPMASTGGRYVLSFNGEAYNFEGLRGEVMSARPEQAWRGHSDTEVLLAAIEIWGLEATLPRIDGMFALALWDRTRNELSLARDRFGEKPLYYGLIEGSLVFGSELRALRAVARLGDGDIDLESVDWMFRTSYVPASRSIFRGVRKLPPASWITISPSDLTDRRLPEPTAYWNAVSAAQAAASTSFVGDETAIVDRLAELLSASVSLRLVADVPVGAMLSGGVDSTCVSAIAQALSSRPLKTFTVGFHDGGYDESAVAEAVAAVLGTDHTTLMVGADEALAAVPAMAGVYDEPFADSSQIPTFMVSRALRTKVTVALSGDAGDELFGGYTRYFAGPRLWDRLAGVPYPLRRSTAMAGSALGARIVDRFAPAFGVTGESLARVHKALGVVDARSDEDFFRRLTSHWPPQDRVSRFGGCLERTALDGQALAADADFARRMMLNDTIDYLPNDILTKVDRAAMAVALETRVPFLDPELFGFAWSLPTSALMRDGVGKLPLRRLAERYVPAEIMNRPKQGFAAPIASWLRGPLKPWADDLLSPSRLARSGFHQTALVEQTWREHRQGLADHSTRLWPILMFEAWRDSL